MKPTVKPTEKNRVIIRVWTSEENKRFSGHNVGHVSIETPDEYMSLWPVPFTKIQKEKYRQAGKLEQMHQKYFMERAADFKQDYKADVTAEEDIECQITMCLYSLDRFMLENEFHKLKADTQAWRLIGSNLLLQTLDEVFVTATTGTTATGFFGTTSLGERHVESCASLALRLLKAGEISELVDIGRYSSFTSKTSSVVKPDDILELLLPAKEAELKQHTETQKFNFVSETSLDDLGITLEAKKAPGGGCVLQ